MGQPYAVDIVFNALDRSQAGTISFLKQIESVDQAVRKTTAASGGAGGGATGGIVGAGGVSSVDRLFDGLTSRLMGATGLRMGIDAVTLGFRMWQYEAMKTTAPLGDVLKKQLEINDTARQIVRDIPFVGRAAARMMEAFSDDEGLKTVVRLIGEVEASTNRTFESIRRGAYDIRRMGLENAGARPWETSSVDIQERQSARQDELNTLRKKTEEAKEAVRVQRKKEEDLAAQLSKPVPTTFGFIPQPQVKPDTTVSDRIQREIVGPAEDALKQAEAADAQRRIEEEKRLQRMREADGELRMAVEQKETDRRAKERYEKFSWERDQQQKLDELRAKQITDQVEREKELINIKYDYEIAKAREAYRDTRLLEEQRAAELAGVRPEKRSARPERTAAEEVRFMSGAYGYNGEYNHTAQMVGYNKTQVDIQTKLLRVNEQILRHLQGQPTISLRPINFG